MLVFSISTCFAFSFIFSSRSQNATALYVPCMHYSTMCKLRPREGKDREQTPLNIEDIKKGQKSPFTYRGDHKNININRITCAQ